MPKKFTPFKQRLAQLGYQNYLEYLQSDHWKAFSAKVRERRCFCCNEPGRLAVHHITYERLGGERFSDVVTVCMPCHTKIHEMVKAGKPLSHAHFFVRRDSTPRQPQTEKPKREKHRGRTIRYLNWEELVESFSKSRKAEFVVILFRHHLAENDQPTQLAVDLGVATEVGSKGLWKDRLTYKLLGKKRRQDRKDERSISSRKGITAASKGRMAKREDIDPWGIPYHFASEYYKCVFMARRIRGYSEAPWAGRCQWIFVGLEEVVAKTDMKEIHRRWWIVMCELDKVRMASGLEPLLKKNKSTT